MTRPGPGGSGWGHVPARARAAAVTGWGPAAPPAHYALVVPDPAGPGAVVGWWPDKDTAVLFAREHRQELGEATPIPLYLVPGRARPA